MKWNALALSLGAPAADAAITPARRPAESPNSSRRSGIEASRLGFINRARSRWLRPRRESSSDAGTDGATERDDTRFEAPARADVVAAAASIAATSSTATPIGRTRRRGKRPSDAGAETCDVEFEGVNGPGAKSQNNALSEIGRGGVLERRFRGAAVNLSRTPEQRHRTHDVGCPTAEKPPHPKSIALSRYKRVFRW